MSRVTRTAFVVFSVVVLTAGCSSADLYSGAGAFAPCDITVVDESHLHAGHVGARDGKGHYRIVVIADVFEGKSIIQRHRMIYSALGELMRARYQT